jgi:hypothetical protein
MKVQRLGRTTSPRASLDRYAPGTNTASTVDGLLSVNYGFFARKCPGLN